MSANTYGRQVVIPLTNKSGGSVAAGDVVVVDTTTDESFTTTTSAASTWAIGVAAETIANNAVGRVIVGGYAPLVNVNAAVTRNQFGTTHTVAKQAVASATRVAGTFCRWLKSSATPSAYIYPVDLAGAALTDPTSARGEVIRRGAAALEALQAKTAGKVLVGDGTDVVSAYPPGYEFDYVQITSAVSVAATSEATATTCITGSAVTYDGSTTVMVEVYSPYLQSPAAVDLTVVLYDGSSSIGKLNLQLDQNANALYRGGTWSRRLTPSNAAHTYSVRAYVGSSTGSFGADTGVSGHYMPAYIRITKV